jgi:SlyX protein
MTLPVRSPEVSRLNEETLEQIQTKIAFLERAVSELSDVLFRQHREIQVLEARLKALSERLSGAQADEASRPPEQERPPHY